jgi:plastocyanin
VDVRTLEDIVDGVINRLNRSRIPSQPFHNRCARHECRTSAYIDRVVQAAANNSWRENWFMSFFRPLRAVPLKALAAGVATLGLALAPGSSAFATTTHWTAVVGSESQDQGIQGNAFFPSDLSINVGDTITWNSNSGEIHTVTFEYGPPPNLSNPFDVVTTPAGGDTFNGSGWFNSGLLTNETPLPAPPPPEFNTYSLKFTAAGDYVFHCLVHSTMQGTLHVLPTTQPVPHTQSFYTQQNIPQENKLLATGRQVKAAGQSSALSASTPSVTAGDGKLFAPATQTSAGSSVAVLRFQPSFTVVHVGDTVTWTNLDPETPHTVTFGGGEPQGGPLAALLPGSTVPGITVSGGQTTLNGPVTSSTQYVNSGFLANPLTPFGINGTQFKVTFTAPGTYQYKCVLHDDLGMVGSIKVLPN